MSRVLVVEDEVVLRGELKRLLQKAGYEVEVAGDVATARKLDPPGFDLVLSDIRLPDATGDSLLSDMGDTPLLLMTAFGTVKGAVKAIKHGAVDYLSKPFEPEELLQVVARVLSQAGAASAGHDEAAAATQPDGAGAPRVGRAPTAGTLHEAPTLLGDSPAMLVVKARLSKVAPTDATVLVLGESGTGKELVARAIHHQSARAAGPFVPVNCASIPDSLIDSELFGHEKGSFTGAAQTTPGLVGAAHRGTLFLDEIGELPPSAQARLLRVLQEHEVRKVGSHSPTQVDVRVVAATHRDLDAMVAEGTFRKDLYYRLRVFELRLPALRDRGEDVVLLTRSLLERAAGRMGKAPPALADDALQALRGARFAGNVRELENALQHALILHEEGPIDAALLGLDLATLPPPGADDERGLSDAADPSLEGYFRRYVLSHQDELGETELAERLGLSRKGLWEKRQRLGIERPGRGSKGQGK